MAICEEIHVDDIICSNAVDVVIGSCNGVVSTLITGSLDRERVLKIAAIIKDKSCSNTILFHSMATNVNTGNLVSIINSSRNTAVLPTNYRAPMFDGLLIRIAPYAPNMVKYLNANPEVQDQITAKVVGGKLYIRGLVTEDVFDLEDDSLIPFTITQALGKNTTVRAKHLIKVLLVDTQDLTNKEQQALSDISKYVTGSLDVLKPIDLLDAILEDAYGVYN